MKQWQLDWESFCDPRGQKIGDPGVAGGATFHAKLCNLLELRVDSWDDMGPSNSSHSFVIELE
ncbi:hypothetical protein J3P71_30200 (plasmid) [Rhizobium leguminosarum]|uniref:hypothetical protein n=1 Tax=Rhizobium leguminosarum TaxID=384 RepID=UPI00144244EE|nr:hypothetical protein [Rhizobium leguminosarum]MBY5835649.1 hypothetical protein [Rhizobium leguminosarum]NKM78284.1 hypothetical protein [Rhizobium leguminosarum bv. viciae]QSZ11968.1 hypothetical protein J3P71_30200 [Rhizobium leguminosarum]